MAKITTDKDRNRPGGTEKGQSHQRAAKKTTTSADRSKRAASSKAKVSGAKPSNRANRSAASTAKVTSSSQTRPSGSRGVFEKPNPKVTTGAGSRMATAAKTANTAKALGKVGALGAVAAAGLTSPPVASGTLTSAMKRGDYKPKQGPAVPARMTQGGMDKGSFNSAFKASRTAKKKTFTWRGKKYTTKKAGE
jgi:hypothetical protein